jgi:hypothetical protein
MLSAMHFILDYYYFEVLLNEDCRDLEVSSIFWLKHIHRPSIILTLSYFSVSSLFETDLISALISANSLILC